MKKILISAILLSSVFSTCLFAQKIGLVLSGGGAKGAYEVGVWKAMEQFKLTKKVKAISGTSVGSLNGALFANVSPKRAEELWINEIGYLTILTPDVDKISYSATGISNFIIQLNKTYESYKTYKEQLKRREFLKNQNENELLLVPAEYEITDNGDITDNGELTYQNNKKVLAGSGINIISYFADFILTEEKTYGMFSRDGLEKVIKREINLKKTQKSQIDVYATVLKKEGLAANAISQLLYRFDRSQAFLLNEQKSIDDISCILLASSAIPFAFDSVTIPSNCIYNSRPIGVTCEYIDGGTNFLGGRNTQTEPFVHRDDLDTIIIVYLGSEEEIDDFVPIKSFTDIGINVIEIIPSRPLGNFFKGTVNFSQSQIRELIDLGYEDSMATLNDYFGE